MILGKSQKLHGARYGEFGGWGLGEIGFLTKN
jgi:hypothetical protein